MMTPGTGVQDEPVAKLEDDSKVYPVTLGDQETMTEVPLSDTERLGGRRKYR